MISRGKPLATLPLALGLGLLATPSRAADWTVECVWGHVPEAARTAYVKEWTQDSAVQTLVKGFKADPMAGCDVPAAERQQAALGLMVYADRNGALHVLQTRLARPSTRVLEAWNGLPEADRRTFAAGVNLKNTPEHTALYRGLVTSLATKLDLLNAEAFPVVSIFVRSQGLLDSIGHGGAKAPT